GELVLPVLVTGTFTQPHFAPDVQRIAQMKLQNLVPNLNDPASLTTGILGSVLGGKNANGAQQQGGLGGIVGAITGQKQQQGQQQPNPQLPANDQTQQPQPPNAVDLLN